MMAENNQFNIINLKGEIVGIYDREGKRFIKLRYEKGFVDVSIQNGTEVYLGDKVTVDSSMEIIQMSPYNEEV